MNRKIDPASERAISTFDGFMGLTRIRLQLATYFCLHRGRLSGKHCGSSTAISGQNPCPEKFRKKLYVIENSRHFDPR